MVKNPENPREDNDEANRLMEALVLNAPLAAAYYLKEDLRRFWKEPHKMRHDDSYRDGSNGLGPPESSNYARWPTPSFCTERDFWPFGTCPSAQAPLEGTNADIKLLQRQAFGYRDQKFFRLRIFALHETHRVLVG